MGKKTWGLLFLSFIVIILAINYFIIRQEQSKSNRLLNIEIPMEQAIREIEVSIWEVGNAISYHIVTPSAMSLEEYKKQLKDVKEFLTKYKKLIETDQEKEMTAKFELKWAKTISIAEELIKLRDIISDLQEKGWNSIDNLDDLLDYKVQPSLVKGTKDQQKKRIISGELEESIWEILSSIYFYNLKQSDEAKREYPEQITEVNDMLKQYKKLNITSAEIININEFEKTWNNSKPLFDKLYLHTDEIQKKYLDFWESLHEVDDVIDFEIQEYLKDRIKKYLN